MKTSLSPKSASTSALRWSRPQRMAVSLLIGLHLLAVFSAPWAAPPPSSDLARTVAGWYRPYAQFFFLNHGYRFFAPEPGPSHLVRYEWTLEDGTKQGGRFPDLPSHRPRLLYHRHFMLSEMVFSLTSLVPELPPAIEPSSILLPDEEREYLGLRRQSQLLHRSIADYLLAERPQAKEVELFLQTHMIPTPLDIQNGIKLTNPDSYQEYSLGVYSRRKP